MGGASSAVRGGRRGGSIPERFAAPALQKRLGVQIPEDPDQPGDEARPAGLVARSQSRPVVTVEVFVEEDQVPPVRLGLEGSAASVHGAGALRITGEDA